MRPVVSGGLLQVRNLAVFLSARRRRLAAVGGAAGGAWVSPVQPANPYWERSGRTFEDPDGYRVVLQHARWSSNSKATR
ncbi:hypothetical protein [Candidatus Amarolinea aalborgensis]|uniref:hypothetical protein n=1 Tax=Candidatus Amarolinea aalborgensis TaxID=2249329 RepID=UPI003BF975F3